MVQPQLQGIGEIFGGKGKSSERERELFMSPKWSCCLLFREPHVFFGPGISIQTVIRE